MKNPFKNFKELQRAKFKPLYAAPGDRIELSYTETLTDNRTGKIVSQEKTVLLSEEVTETMTFDEAVAFRGEYEDRQALGGMFLEQSKP